MPLSSNLSKLKRYSPRSKEPSEEKRKSELTRLNTANEGSADVSDMQLEGNKVRILAVPEIIV